ncbi:peptide/nickel transport system permease protein [Propionibacterium cyclohexanicum]|uniref:Peptide/nickel transport system permease protein n=1 Tax=Propionibacterium cyclohexanicum TaxID=64702 RepID=A0A1H9QYT5_9ACTN|nr:ABC transporter permease [Propionibacterium cyclohexanicum]SER65537.1 peptide/nickel transport system permease protein [Propionibacterium cyclohexanicum]
MRRAGLIAGTACVGVVVVMALVALFWTPYDPGQVEASQALAQPSAAHLFGTDGFGRDIFSQLLVGARICLQVGIVSVAIGALVGVPLGIWAGMAPGRIGRAIMRVSDVLYAFPALLLAILLAAARGSASTGTAMVAIGVSTVPAFARVAHGATRSVMARDYVAAARASGIGWGGIARTHVLVNIAPVVLVQTSTSFGLAILAEAGLSYLGIGTAPTTPSWGRMLYDAQKYLYQAPLQLLWPGMFIAVAVLGFNLLGDGLRDALDPRLRTGRHDD